MNFNHNRDAKVNLKDDKQITYDDDDSVETHQEENGTPQEVIYMNWLRKIAKENGVPLNPPAQPEGGM